MAAYRIAMVIPTLGMGGAERVLTLMAGEWAKAGRLVTIFTFDDGRAAPFYKLGPGVVHHALGLLGASRGMGKVLNNLGRIRVLRNALRQCRPDAVVSFLDTTNMTTLFASFGLGFPVVVAERTSPQHNVIHPAWLAIRPWAYRLADRIVVQTLASAAFFRPAFEGKLSVIPNPVTRPDLGPDGLPPLLQRKRVIVGLGRLISYKGFDVLIKAFARIHDRHPEWSLRIVGEGPMRRQLEDLADSLGLRNRVQLPGPTRNPHGCFAEAQIFALSSRFEGFPNALCEAMACGLAVVATDCEEGPGEIIQSGMGVLTPVDDVESMAKELENLILDPDRRASFGARAQEVCTRYGIGPIMDRWSEIVDEAATTRAGRPKSVPGEAPLSFRKA